MAKRQSSQFNTRQYMLSEDFEVFYYSDTHFRSMGSHSHDYYELYFFEEGAVTMVIDEKPYPLRQGDVILIPPGVSHRAQLTDGEKPYRRFVFWVSQPFLAVLEGRSPAYGYLLRRAEDRADMYTASICPPSTPSGPGCSPSWMRSMRTGSPRRPPSPSASRSCCCSWAEPSMNRNSAATERSS